MRPVAVFTDASQGSFALSEPADVLVDRRARITGYSTAWLRQVHGANVVTVTANGVCHGEPGDAAVTVEPGVALSVITADCAPILLGAQGVVGAVHAGWRGLVAGVIQETVARMRALGASEIQAWLGPCIRTRCYEFGESDLDEVARVLGSDVRGVTAWGSPALDVGAAVRAALSDLGVHRLTDSGICTACSPVHFSHRARGDSGRQAGFVWLERE